MANPFSDPEMADYWTAMIRDEINPFRKYVTDPALFRRLDGWVEPMSVLELGCGEGYIVRWLAEQGHQLTGFDLSLPLLNAAKGLEEHGSDFVNGDVLALPFSDGVKENGRSSAWGVKAYFSRQRGSGRQKEI